MTPTPLFTHTYIDDQLIMIRDLMGDIMYLIIGSKEAVLIDTGLGIGSLRSYVEALTTRPITVLLTHGHMDHAMGAPEFEHIYMNPEDDAQYKDHSEKNYRNRINRQFMGQNYDSLLPFLIPSQPLIYEPLLPGMAFDLGGLTLRIFNGAGHTKGSVVILIEEKRLLIIGDACTNNTLLLNERATDVRTYMNNMIALKKDTAGFYDALYFSHGRGKKPCEYIDSMITLCDEVLHGISDEVPYNWIGYDLLVARDRDERLRRYDGGLANLAYQRGKELT
jgi:glyoxylase-like metal-dependent hydrolase (beta-lactamase superfamily II)